MKHISRVIEENKIIEIEKVKSKMLLPFSAPKGIWQFDFKKDFLLSNSL